MDITINNRKTTEQGSRLNTALSRIRTHLPLPHELLQAADTEERDRLAIIIETTPVGRPIIDLAHQLSSKDLRHIFPLLAEKIRPEDLPVQYHDKLFLIIRERACHSLYHYGWAVFQQVYPDAAVSRGLAILCGILEIRQKSGLLQKKSGQAAKKSITPPPLISRLATPGSRRFIDHLVTSLARMQVPLEHFIKQYDIDPGQPFGAALIGQCFIRGQAELYQGSHYLFEQALFHATPELQVALVKRLLSIALDLETKTQCLQVLYRLLGNPDSGHPIWSQLRRKDVQVYRSWISAATIGRHCQGSKAKARFYHRYAGLVQQAEQWDEHTLVLSFSGFMIVDDRRQPLFALYYEQDNPMILPAVLRHDDDSSPGSASIPHRRVEDAVSRASTYGPVGLVFDEKGMRISASFIDFCLYQKNIASRNRLKNLPPLPGPARTAD